MDATVALFETLSVAAGSSVPAIVIVRSPLPGTVPSMHITVVAPVQPAGVAAVTRARRDVRYNGLHRVGLTTVFIASDGPSMWTAII